MKRLEKMIGAQENVYCGSSIWPLKDKIIDR